MKKRLKKGYADRMKLRWIRQIGLRPAFTVIAGVLIPAYSFGMCGAAPHELTLLRWSKDGNSAVMIGYLQNEIDFFVIEGHTRQIYTFPLSINGHRIYEGTGRLVSDSNDLNSKECQKNMNDLNAMLTKDGIEKIPLVTNPCALNGSRSLSEQDLGSERTQGNSISSDRYSGEYESEFLSPTKELKFNIKGNAMCGGNRVIAYQKEANTYLEFHRW